MRFGFIGLGNLGDAIVRGISVAPSFADDEIFGFDVLEARRSELAASTKMQPCDSIASVVAAADVIILTVKPHILTLIMDEIKAAITSPSQMFLSVAAGRSLAALEAGLGNANPIVRVMPNINAMVAASTSAYAVNERADQSHKEITEKIFGSVGTVSELPEAMFAQFTAVAGSAPAFSYMFIDALAKTAVQLGIPRDQAVEMAASTVLGSAKMVLESQVHPLELADRVCSPGGVAIEGVMALQENGFEHAVHQAVLASYNKNQKL